MAEWILNANGEAWPVTVPDERIVSLPRVAAATATPRELVKAALEKPFNFEPLRRALTPDDRIAVVLDERLPHLAELISGVLDHLATAGIDPNAVTLISPNPKSKQTWIDDLPDEFAEVQTEIHNPNDRKKLAYLAATKAGEPVYLNRTLVEAEFIVVLSGHRHDEHTGEHWLSPGLSDAAHQEKAAAAGTPHEENETVWLLGTPFFVRVIEGAGGSIQNVIAGLTDSKAEASRIRDERWNRIVAVQPETVIVSAPSHSFEECAAAMARAERVVAPEGRIVVLMQEAPHMPDAVDVLRIANEPSDAIRKLNSSHPEGWRAAAQWAESAAHAALFLAGPMTQEACEELFATSIASAAELQRLLSRGMVMKLDDAHLARVHFEARKK